MSRKIAATLLITLVFSATVALAQGPGFAPMPVAQSQPPTFVVQEPIQAPAAPGQPAAAPMPAPPAPVMNGPCADPCASVCQPACPVADACCEEAPQKKKREHFTLCDYWEIMKACLYWEH
jgi:hypothetical protein